MQGDSSTTDYRIFIQDKGKHIKRDICTLSEITGVQSMLNAEVLHRWQKRFCLA